MDLCRSGCFRILYFNVFFCKNTSGSLAEEAHIEFTLSRVLKYGRTSGQSTRKAKDETRRDQQSAIMYTTVKDYKKKKRGQIKLGMRVPFFPKGANKVTDPTLPK